jgi:type I restriction enzyme R subunit
MAGGMSEAQWELLALDTLGEIGWEPLGGAKIAPGSGERESWDELIIPHRLRDAIARINPKLSQQAIDDAVKTVLTPKSRDVCSENREVHKYLTEGIRSVVFTDVRGAEQNPTIKLIDTRDPWSNDFLAVSQVQVIEGERRRRFDIVLYLNGLPVGVIELKKAGDGQATLEDAYAQLMTYVDELPLAFRCNVVCLVADGIRARYGTAYTPFEHFAPWNVDDEGTPIPQPPAPGHDEDLAINLALHGLFRPDRFVELLNGYVAFAYADSKLIKLIAKSHQYFAVSKAVGKTIEATRSDGRAGVVWHTQGSGKSLEMEFYANQVLTHPAFGNPTILVLTDRLDLDSQLFDSFDASELLTDQPRQVATRDKLWEELSGKTVGGIVFSTLQKFGLTKAEKEAGTKYPQLSDRRNIIVIVDEAHRGHYGLLEGYAHNLRRALPLATLVAFTGTPISEPERNTQAVFGDYIDVYDLTRAVEDKATVRVFYESRLIPVDLPEGVDPELIDERADEATTGLDDSERERITQAVTVMNAVYGAPDRLRTLARDIVDHWAARSGEMRKFIGIPGKGMIVCATRDICAELYEQIIAIKPDWHSDSIERGKIKVVYSGDARDEQPIRKHVRRPSQNKAIQRRAKSDDLAQELELVIVQSMWLTGYDSPPLHTLYVDKPMRGAALMQALARVNRTFRDKQDGLLVGYAPLEGNLLEAIAEYSDRDQAARPLGHDMDEALAKVRELHEIIGNVILGGCDWRGALAAKSPRAYLNAVLGALEYLRDPQTPGNVVEAGDQSLTQRFGKEASRLARFYAVCSTSIDLRDYRDDIAFFEQVRVYLAKFEAEERRERGLAVPAEVELYLRQLTAGSIEATGVTDVYEAAGVGRPDLSQLDEAFIERMQRNRHPNLVIEALRRLIEEQKRKVTRHNIVRQQSFSDRLLELMNKHHNQQLTSAEIIAELVAMAKDLATDADRGARFSPALTSDELAFYDTVARNESAVSEMGTGVLADIARDLVKSLRNSVSVDWVSRDDVRAKLRSVIKRLLAKYGYPPDAQPEATEMVIRQMETFADEWAPQAGE